MLLILLLVYYMTSSGVILLAINSFFHNGYSTAIPNSLRISNDAINRILYIYKRNNVL